MAQVIQVIIQFSFF